METIRAFVHMNGYGLYVWPAFGVAAAVFVWMWLSTLRRLRVNERTLVQLQDIRRKIEENEAGATAPRNGEHGT